MFCYDFHPDSHTLVDEHLNPEAVFAYNSRKRPLGMPVPERLLWSYVTQLANAIKAIHSSGLAARVIDASKILVTGKNRSVLRRITIKRKLTSCSIRLNCCGILDVLAYDASTPLINYQVRSCSFRSSYEADSFSKKTS
jgi:PAB-dependent poly(A)-specific ribonuclease subunit 3